MGVDAGDYDGDGWVDLFVTNFAQETNSLYRNEEGRLFENTVFPGGLAAPSLVRLGFGTLLLDLNLDGFLDLVVANGHIEDRIALYYDFQTHPQPNQVFRNHGDGTFEEVSETAGEAFSEARVSRGLAAADFDLDGDLDLLVTNCGGAAQLLENRTVPRGRWAALLLQTGSPPRVALGARIVAHTGERRLLREVRIGGSYLSQSDPWIHLGLGEDERIHRLEIRWPSGKGEEFGEVEAGRRYRVVEGEGRLEVVPHPR